VFNRFKAALPDPALNAYAARHDALDALAKRLAASEEKADIGELMRDLQSLVDEAIATQNGTAGGEGRIYDLSNLDFSRLRAEFARAPHKHTLVQALKARIEARLAKMLAANPARADFYERYQAIIAAYNHEKERITIEETFEQLSFFFEALDEEDKRHIREGLTEEQLALFDLMEKPGLKPAEREQLKTVARELLDGLKAGKLRTPHWRDNSVTQAGVKAEIYNYLFQHLPGDLADDAALGATTEIVFQHVLTQYDDAAHNVYTRLS